MKTRSLKTASASEARMRAFLSELASCGLLTREQLEKVEEVQQECNVNMLVELLTDLQWLTPYQVEEILAGRGDGLRVGQYRILNELGEGGFGKVYRAVHALMKREAAIKFLN